MLVLSRRPNESIVFPNIGVTIEVLGQKGNRIRLGIDAPAHVEVARGEVIASRLPARANHRLRNELNSITLMIEMYHRQLESGSHERARVTFNQILSRFRDVEAQFGGGVLTPEPAAPIERSILLVEDDHNERELLASVLRMDGHSVATARTGGEAVTRLTHAGTEIPDLVLLDIGLPEISGEQTVRWIRNVPHLHQLPVMVVSGYRPHDCEITVGTEDGVTAWFEKPLNVPDIIRAIRETPQQDVAPPMSSPA